MIWLYLMFVGSVGEFQHTGQSCSVPLAALSSTVCVVLFEKFVYARPGQKQLMCSYA